MNFYYTIDKHKENLKKVYDEVFTILNSLENEILLITTERDKELAHKDISTGISVRIYLNYMNEIETLIVKAREILEKLFGANEAGIEIKNHENKTLKKIIEFLKEEKSKYLNDTYAWIEESNKSK